MRTIPKRTAASTLPPTEPIQPRLRAGLVDAHGLLRALWPDEDCRPTLRWVREMQARRVFPFLKIGRLVYFDVTRVSEAIQKMEVVSK